jgi:hypothetical protein
MQGLCNAILSFSLVYNGLDPIIFFNCIAKLLSTSVHSPNRSKPMLGGIVVGIAVTGLMLLAGCSAMPGESTAANFGLIRLDGTRTLELPQSCAVQLRDDATTIKLARGCYRAMFAGGTGCYYYEAPFSQNPEMFFSNGRRGGIYVQQTDNGCRAFLYIQRNTITSAYVQGGAPFTFGGAGTFSIAQELPQNFVDQIKLQLQ